MTVLTGALTINHYNDIIDSFIKNVADSSKAYYIFVGRAHPWDDDVNPPMAESSIFEYEQTTYDEIVYGKKIRYDDIAYLIPRINWVNGTHYDRYDQKDNNLYSKKFYVVTNENNVYKCIDNNFGAASTVKPISTTTVNTFKTADGYVWKYMYTVPSDLNYKFSSAKYIPSITNTEVKTNASPGTIDFIRVTNSGNNYVTHAHGFIDAFDANTPVIVQLANNSQRNNFSRLNNYYQGSSIYLKTGYGAGQIRKIRASDGNAKTVSVDEPFDVYARMYVKDLINEDNIFVGQIVTQKLEAVEYTYLSNYFNEGDVIVQCETLASGIVRQANDVVLTVQMLTDDKLDASGKPINFIVDNTTGNIKFQRFPIYKTTDPGTLITTTTGEIRSGYNLVNGNSSAKFITGPGKLSVNNYIRVGKDARYNIRRVTKINSETEVQVAEPFLDTTTSDLYLVATAATPVSVLPMTDASGYINDVNVRGYEITIDKTTLSIKGKNFTVGENVNMVDVNNVPFGSNGIVTYSNTSVIIINNKVGLEFVAGNYLYGSESLQKAKISAVRKYPNLTIKNPRGHFKSGFKIHVRPADYKFLTEEMANATLVATYYTPNESTEYLITPTVTIDGDGDGAKAYSVVNNVTQSISSIVMVNTGVGYTYANISITANTNYGHHATAEPVISPINGHGYDVNKELGARYAGISITVNGSENNRIPSYGYFRKIGIIENPVFKEVTLHLDSFDRIKLKLKNMSDAFFENEVVTQTGNSTVKPAGVVTAVYSDVDGDYIEIKNINNNQKWLFSSTGDDIFGRTSLSTANAITANINYFSIPGANVEIVSEITSGANAILSEADPANINYETRTQIVKLSNVSGQLDYRDQLVDYSTNSYANVVGIYIANGDVETSLTFGKLFNQTARVTLTEAITLQNRTDGVSGVGFNDFEYAHQEYTNASGRIIEQYKDVDLLLNSETAEGDFIAGDTITVIAGSPDSVAANGTVLWANTSYIKVTNINVDSFTSKKDAFINGETISNGRASAVIESVYPVLLLNDVAGPFQFERDPLGSGQVYVITGIGSPRDNIPASGSHGRNNIANTIIIPELVRESGKVLYVNNIQPFEKSSSSNEKVSLVIKF
jgi:hypothetical protein